MGNNFDHAEGLGKSAASKHVLANPLWKRLGRPDRAAAMQKRENDCLTRDETRMLESQKPYERSLKRGNEAAKL